MLRNYITIAWRNITRQKMYSSIKIGGFAVGVAACLVIALYVHQDLSYDTFYSNAGRVYRIIRITTFRGQRYEGVHFPSPFTAALQESFPELEKAGHLTSSSENELRRTDRLENTHEGRFAYFDQAMLDILEVPFVAGDATTALTQPKSIVITKTKANQYFKGEDPIGKALIINNDDTQQYTVTGVVSDFGPSSHLQYDFLMTLAGKELWPGELDNWSSSNHLNYVRVKAGTNIAVLEDRLKLMLPKYFLPGAIRLGAKKQEIDWVNSMQFKLQPVTDIYLNNAINDGLRHGDIRYVWLFGSIASFILLIACINFINLSTARSAGRAKEIGLRKVSGSTRSSLVRQFLVESIVFSIGSFIVGGCLAWIGLPYVSEVLARPMSFPLQEVWFLPAMVTGALVVGVVAGLYPAFYLSSFRPAVVLKGTTTGHKNSATRSALVVSQFVISILLIISTIVIHRQMDYVLTKNLGFDKNQVMMLEGTYTLGDKAATLKQELLRLPGVKSVSVSGFLPVTGTSRDGGGTWKEGMTNEESVQSQHWKVDADYVKTLGLTIVEGQDFSANMGYTSETKKVLINEWLAKSLNMKDPVGQTIISIRGNYTVAGVIKDFHFESLRRGIEGMVLYLEPSNNSMAIKIDASAMQSVIGPVTTVWKQFSPHQPIRYSFLDERYAQMYDDVKRTGKIFTSFAVLAIVVACLGLFALSAYMVERRGKEISIRLVLGASLKSIVNLLTVHFVKLVLISFCIATPLSWYGMTRWLEDFSYQTPITWDIFMVSGVLALFIALATISYQSIKAAFANPAEILKAE